MQLGNVCDFAIGKKIFPPSNESTYAMCTQKTLEAKENWGGGGGERPRYKDGHGRLGTEARRKKWAIAALGLFSLNKKDIPTCIISLVQLDLPRYGSLQVFALQLPYTKEKIR